MSNTTKDLLLATLTPNIGNNVDPSKKEVGEISPQPFRKKKHHNSPMYLTPTVASINSTTGFFLLDINHHGNHSTTTTGKTTKNEPLKFQSHDFCLGVDARESLPRIMARVGITRTISYPNSVHRYAANIHCY